MLAAATAMKADVLKQVGEQARGMKVRASVKKMCEGCKVRAFHCEGISGWICCVKSRVASRKHNPSDVGGEGVQGMSRGQASGTQHELEDSYAAIPWQG